MADGRTVVVGYDGSPPAKAAFRCALEEAGPGGSVYVVHAFGPPPEWLGRPWYQQVLDAHKDHGRAALAEIAPDGETEMDGVRVFTELLAGSPAETLHQVATTRNADRIVVGSRGFGAMRASLGSVSHELLHLADRPVLVLPASALAGD